LRRQAQHIVAKAGEQAWETGTVKCQSSNAEVRVQKGARIPDCPNGHTRYDERIEELGRRSS